MPYLYCILLLLLAAPGWAQRITNVQAEAIGDYVSIRYDLVEDVPGQVFDVALYSSHDNFQTPLRYVRGEIGSQVEPGKQKVMEWGAQKELTRFQGDISFEIKAKLVFSPIAILTPQVESIFRRGHVYTLQWKGGLSDEKVRLELVRDGFENQIIDQVLNTGSYTWRVDDETPLGENYRLKITERTDQAVNSQLSDLFAIKRRIPTIVKFIPVGILVGAATIWMIGQVGGSGEDSGPLLPPPPQDDLK